MIFHFDRFRIPVLLLITLPLVSSCAGPPAPIPLPDLEHLEVDNWLELSSPDFILYSCGSRSDLEAYAVDLARFVAVVEELVHSQPPTPPAQILLVDGYAEKLFMPRTNVAGFMSHSLAGFSGFTCGSSHDPTRRFTLCGSMIRPRSTTRARRLYGASGPRRIPCRARAFRRIRNPIDAFLQRPEPFRQCNRPGRKHNTTPCAQPPGQ